MKLRSHTTKKKKFKTTTSNEGEDFATLIMVFDLVGRERETVRARAALMCKVHFKKVTNFASHACMLSGDLG